MKKNGTTRREWTLCFYLESHIIWIHGFTYTQPQIHIYIEEYLYKEGMSIYVTINTYFLTADWEDLKTMIPQKHALLSTQY